MAAETGPVIQVHGPGQPGTSCRAMRSARMPASGPVPTTHRTGSARCRPQPDCCYIVLIDFALMWRGQVSHGPLPLRRTIRDGFMERIALFRRPWSPSPIGAGRSVLGRWRASSCRQGGAEIRIVAPASPSSCTKRLASAGLRCASRLQVNRRR